MLHLSNKDKQFLLYLITNCEIYQLNEQEALEYIKNKFSKRISRRSYYNYKNQMYKDHDKNAAFFGLLRFHESKQSSKDIASLSLISHRERIIRDGLLNKNISSHDEFSRLDDPKLSLEKMREKAKYLIKEGEKVLVKIIQKYKLLVKTLSPYPKKQQYEKSM